MGDEWGKCMKRKCAIPLCMNGIAHDIMGRCQAEWGNGGQLWGVVQPSGVFNGLVDGFTEILVFFCSTFVANVAAVLVVI